MADLKPTARLRWVHRKVRTQQVNVGPDIWAEHTVSILQQLWQPDVPHYMLSDEDRSEWRDIETVVESG